MRVFISTHMLSLKFPAIHGMGRVRSDQLVPRSCYTSAVKSTNPHQRRESLSVTKAQPPHWAGIKRPEDSREEFVTQQAKPVEDLELVCLHEDLPDWQVQIGTALSPNLHSAHIAFLKRCAYDLERYEAMKAEVDKLSSIGFIKEVDYTTWLANVVIVRKPKKGWRMCVDYINLNRACPKDSFPLPRID
ncbi:unnamed protein product [Prunus armeniaca]